MSSALSCADGLLLKTLPLQRNDVLLFQHNSSWKELHNFGQGMVEGSINESFNLEVPQDSVLDFQVWHPTLQSPRDA